MEGTGLRTPGGYPREVNRLDEILGAARERIEAGRRRRPLHALERDAAGALPPRDFLGAVAAPGISLIAEVKRRSPSAGEIRPGAEPAAVAAAYERGGARAVSVLTEPRFFGGSLDDLAAVRAASGLPVLRKDFVLDPWQVVEARASGADAVLLIVAALEGAMLGDLLAAAGELRMAAIVEVHAEEELEAALALRPSLVGVNQRDLRTFEVDPGLAVRLRARVPAGVAVVAESGIWERSQVEELEKHGVEAVLVGESLMRAEDPEAAVAGLLGARVTGGAP